MVKTGHVQESYKKNFQMWFCELDWVIDDSIIENTICYLRITFLSN